MQSCNPFDHPSEKTTIDMASRSHTLRHSHPYIIHGSFSLCQKKLDDCKTSVIPRPSRTSVFPWHECELLGLDEDALTLTWKSSYQNLLVLNKEEGEKGEKLLRPPKQFSPASTTSAEWDSLNPNLFAVRSQYISHSWILRIFHHL